jgi:hypothetical protein
VKGHLGLFFSAMSGVSLASGALAYIGYRELVPSFLVFIISGVLAFAYLYAEGGVWNQVQRDQADLSNNYADPNARINSEMSSRAIVAALQGSELDADQREALKNELDASFAMLRDGVDVESLDD